MMLNFLVPTDFSENAWNATRYAIQFFEKQPVTFHFLHIDSAGFAEQQPHMHQPGFSVSGDTGMNSRDSMQVWMNRLKELPSNPNHCYLNSINKMPFITGVREYLKTHQIVFMILGTKGASGLKAATVGSKTGEIITKVKCNALVVPEKASFSIPYNIAFTTDYTIDFTEPLIAALKRFADHHKSSIKILRVAKNKETLSTDHKRNRAYLKSQLKHINHSFHVVENIDLEDGLEAFAHKMQIDVVALIAKNLNFFQKLLFTPGVAPLTYRATIPFFIIHE
ncbi:universal stress protein [Leeuwenhoekiella sp. H156]|uniref:universal stress protein n=1 Tax=Leeuwenhoekiella sp. H156 TaxID=3450128 RepID=UPI003FA44C78